MNDLSCISSKFELNGYWSNSIPEENLDFDFLESNRCVNLFDHNGYDLCPLELEYLKYNSSFPLVMHRNEKHYSLQKPWFTQKEKLSGYVLNHSMILERKGYTGPALEQLQKLAKRNPLIYKVIKIQPKWGCDFSLDYVDEKSEEVFEIFHHEYDGFDVETAQTMKNKLEKIIQGTNFDEVSLDFIKRKNEWMNLEFFAQSEWKCKYFGVPNERFKLVTWYGEPTAVVS